MANLDGLGMQWAVALSGSILPLRSERINKRAERTIWLEMVKSMLFPRLSDLNLVGAFFLRVLFYV